MKTIRLAKPDECKQLSELAVRSKAYWGYSKEFMEACRDELTYTADDLKPGLFCIIQDDAIPVGFYGLTIISETVFELEALFVEPDFIGKGYGQQLIEHAKLTVRQLGGEKLMIQGDPNARAFYLKAGGTLVGERESDSIPGRFLPLFCITLKS